jgi:hypothetical protein
MFFLIFLLYRRIRIHMDLDLGSPKNKWILRIRIATMLNRFIIFWKTQQNYLIFQLECLIWCETITALGEEKHQHC